MSALERTLVEALVALLAACNTIEINAEQGATVTIYEAGQTRGNNDVSPDTSADIGAL
jgi:hypothetical protein